MEHCQQGTQAFLSQVEGADGTRYTLTEVAVSNPALVTEQSLSYKPRQQQQESLVFSEVNDPYSNLSRKLVNLTGLSGPNLGLDHPAWKTLHTDSSPAPSIIKPSQTLMGAVLIHGSELTGIDRTTGT